MLWNLVLLWGLALPLMGSPGPATLSLAGLGAAYGWRPALPYLAGIVSGTGAVVVLIATGVTGVILAEPALLTAVSAAAGLYILYLAYRIATAPPPAAATAGSQPPRFVPGFALAVANPKAYAAIGAVYAGVAVVPGAPLADAMVKVGALWLVVVAVNTAWLLAGSALAARLRDARWGRVLNRTFAVLLVASVAAAWLVH